MLNIKSIYLLAFKYETIEFLEVHFYNIGMCHDVFIFFCTNSYVGSWDFFYNIYNCYSKRIEKLQSDCKQHTTTRNSLFC